MKKIFLFIGLLFSQLVMAGPTGEDARALAESQIRVILNKAKENKQLYTSNPEAFDQMIEQEVLPYMDFKTMSKFVLGRNAKSVPAAKQEEFSKAFQKFLIRAYTKGWQDYTDTNLDETLKFLNTPKVNNNRAVMKVQVKNKQGKVSQLDFALSYSGGQWKIYDVIFENVSFLMSYRSSFENIIKQEGIDSLINKLNNGSIVRQ